jgi:hypothetical protein
MILLAAAGYITGISNCRRGGCLIRRHPQHASGSVSA